RFQASLDRRAAGEPVAYIRGIKEFHGLAFGIDPRALIPRPETERLVELAELEIVRSRLGAPRPAGSPPVRVIDVGVGSGAVAVTLAVLLRRRGMLDEVTLAATDLSEDALQLARENAVAHAVGDRIAFSTADLLPGSETTRWDVVAANLPYVRSGAMPTLPVATSYEPATALDGGPDGLTVIGRLLDQLPDALAPHGVALLVADADQAKDAGELNAPAAALAARFWPGGLTLVVPRRRDRTLPGALTGEGALATVGLRVPDHDAPRALARAVGPLPTTSANRSGEPEARDADELQVQLGDALDLILDGGPAG